MTRRKINHLQLLGFIRHDDSVHADGSLLLQQLATARRPIPAGGRNRPREVTGGPPRAAGSRTPPGAAGTSCWGLYSHRTTSPSGTEVAPVRLHGQLGRGVRPG